MSDDFDQLVADLEGDEAFREVVYDDANGAPLKPGSTLVGWPTIGFGWNLATDPMSLIEARDRLRRRALLAQKDALSLVADWSAHNAVRQNVLSNMAYNLGHARLSGFKLMLAAVDGRNYAEAARQMRSSAWYRQVGHRGVRLATQMETGVRS
jgi:lysozyme